MKERAITLAFACGALVLFYAMFISRSVPRAVQMSQPLSTERGPNGYLALRHWFEAENFPVASFKQRYDKLAGEMKSSGNLLITTMPHRLAARPKEIQKLHEWIAAGNTVLVMAGLADTPEWAMDGQHNGNLEVQLRELIDIEFYPRSKREQKKNSAETGAQVVDAIQKLLRPSEREARPVGEHPLMAGVRAVEAVSEFPADDWFARPKDDSAAVISLARLSTTEATEAAPALWLANYGEGQIIVSAFASPFVNKLIDHRDNARLLANIVAWSVKHSGMILLDDAHQGLVSFYDGQAFFRDPRLHHTIVWLLGLWLIFVLGPLRLRPVMSRWKPVDIISFVRATGGFMARTLRPSEAARRELVLFFNGIRRRLALPENGAPVWEWLETQGNVAASDVMELRADYDRIANGDRVNFSRLHNLLQRIKGSFV